MPTRDANAVWSGNLQAGKGKLKLGSGAFEGDYTVPGRFENGGGTNPEELLGAAHAGCFSMQLAAFLSQAGFEPDSVDTTAKVTLSKDGEGFSISKIALHNSSKVAGIDEATFQEHAEKAKKNCPISKALAATDITLDAKLAS